jgi:DNA-binding response OmpR family regulator
MNSKASLDGLRILMAEDQAPTRRELKSLLEISRARDDAVENGARACELGAKIRYDAILLDLQMPVLDGLSAASRLRSEGYAGPLFAISSHRDPKIHEQVRALGFDHFFPKPLDYRALEARLRMLKKEKN